MSPTNPSTIFGGSWEQITDRFLYCANSSKETGGSKTITVGNLPSHTHTFIGENISGNITALLRYDAANDASWSVDGCFSSTSLDGKRSWAGNNTIGSKAIINFSATPSGTISSTGSGTDYLPPYITVYCWYRTA